MLNPGFVLLAVVAMVTAEDIDRGNACDSHPCQNGYACTATRHHGYKCSCDVELGQDCQLATRELYFNCASSKTNCATDETCIFEAVICKTWPCPGQAICVKKSPDICTRNNPCRHGSTCSVTSDGDFRCACKDLFFLGRQCDQLII